MNIKLHLLTPTATALLLSLTACSRHAEQAPQPPSLPAANVQVHTVGETSHEAFEEAVGTIQAQLRAVIEAKVSGRVEKMPVITGQKVKINDLLVQLDSREIQARLEQANALRDQADADLQRFTALLQEEAVTRSEYDGVQARHRVAQAAVTEAETQLAHTRVISPFDGVITRKFADVGDLAAPGRQLLAIEDPSRLRLEANIPEALIDRIPQGGTLRVQIDSTKQTFAGTVSEISPSADPNSRTFLVKIDLPATPELRAGQFGRVSIPVGSFAALRVPSKSLVKRGQLETIFVAQDGTAHLRLVKTGKILGDETEILSGLNAGEQVITEGLTGLLDNQPVKVSP
ncbi:MAG: hypothetical protein RI897_1116 [Verrucomicrobiota bacterium]